GQALPREIQLAGHRGRDRPEPRVQDMRADIGVDVVASDSAAAALYERLGWSLLAVVDQRWRPEQTVKVRCYAAP
ncbi:hypothetical protein ACWCOZ_25960, partial [Streptomyces sp. NPDC001840]